MSQDSLEGDPPKRFCDHDILDEKKRQRAIYILEKISLKEIRETSLATLARWKTQGAWCSAYSEWEVLMREGSDEAWPVPELKDTTLS